MAPPAQRAPIHGAQHGIRKGNIHGNALAGSANIRAVVQALACQVERHRRLAAVDANGDDGVRMLCIHGGTLAPDLANLVADAILDALRREMRVAELLVRAAGEHGDLRVFCKDLVPRQLTDVAVQIIGVFAAHASDKQQDARCQARPQQGPVRAFLVRIERHAAAQRTRLLDAERFQLATQGFFQAHLAAGEVFGIEWVFGIFGIFGLIAAVRSSGNGFGRFHCLLRFRFGLFAGQTALTRSLKSCRLRSASFFRRASRRAAMTSERLS